MVEVCRARISDILRSYSDRVAAGWVERGVPHPYSPDLARYQAAQDSGALICFAAYVDHDWIGFVTAFVADALMTGARYGVSDSLYVVPERRGSKAALLLMAAAEAEAKRRGAVDFGWCAADAKQARMYAKRGYTLADVVMRRAL